MKIRNGFVSNSSSSSFLVEIQKDWMNRALGDKTPTELITIRQRKLLYEYGFRPTTAHHPMYLYNHAVFGEKGSDAWIWNVKPFHYKHGMVRYGYSVSCNEDEVIEFLLMHGISFHAVTHYGHWHVIYNGGKVFWKIQNIGEEIGMYGRKNPSTEYKEIVESWKGRGNRLFQQIKVEDYLHPKPPTARQKAIIKKRLAKLRKDLKKQKKVPLNRAEQLIDKWGKRLGWKKPARAVVKSYVISKIKPVKIPVTQEESIPRIRKPTEFKHKTPEILKLYNRATRKLRRIENT